MIVAFDIIRFFFPSVGNGRPDDLRKRRRAPKPFSKPVYVALHRSLKRVRLRTKHVFKHLACESGYGRMDSHILVTGDRYTRTIALVFLAALTLSTEVAGQEKPSSAQCFDCAKRADGQGLDGKTLAAFLSERKGSNGQSDASLSYVANTEPPDAYVSLRTDPVSSRGTRIMKMPNGTLLKVLKRQPDGWWYVRVVPTGQTGWALSGGSDKQWIECCKAATDADISASGSAREEVSPAQSSATAVTQPPSATNQPMSSEELMAFQTKLLSLWRKPVGIGSDELSVDVRIKLKPNGMLAGPVEVVKPKGSPRSVMDDSAVKAVIDGQPYSMLKPETYDNWKDIIFTFDRRQGNASK
jgi:hypothetical protein